jgi:hypothetical protein
LPKEVVLNKELPSGTPLPRRKPDLNFGAPSACPPVRRVKPRRPVAIFPIDQRDRSEIRIPFMSIKTDLNFGQFFPLTVEAVDFSDVRSNEGKP